MTWAKELARYGIHRTFNAPRAADGVVATTVERTRPRQAEETPDDPRGSLPIRSQIYSHKDSTVNYMRLRLRTADMDPEEPPVSLVKLEANYDEAREEVKAAHRTDRFILMKKVALERHMFDQDKYSERIPPVDFVTKLSDRLMHKYPKGIDRAKEFPSTVEQVGGGESWWGAGGVWGAGANRAAIVLTTPRTPRLSASVLGQDGG